MTIEEIRAAYLGKTIEPEDFDTDEFTEDPPGDAFVWAESEEDDSFRDEYDLEELREEFHEEYLASNPPEPDEDDEDGEPIEPDWDNIDGNEFNDWLYERTGWTLYEAENGRTVFIVYSASYRIDENGVLLEIGELTKRKLLGDDACHTNYEEMEVDDWDYDTLDSKLDMIVYEPEDEDEEEDD